MSASVHRAIPGPQTVPQGMPAVRAQRRSQHGRELSAHRHAVQFYENDRFLAETVVDYFATGLVSGQRCVAIATREHREAFAAGLHAKGFDVERASANGQLALLDAEELLAACMVGSLPDASRFRLALSGLLGGHDELPDGTGSRATVLAFAELVDVLWRQNNLEGALRVEELWNELATVCSFTLLCAYSLSTFGQDTHDAPLRAICNQHTHVVPTERFMQIDEEFRPREIALLQQRALALETELERRRDLEESLREALRSAQAAARSKSEFLSVMSHELRTPLNAIGGHAQLLEMELHGPINDAQREALARVQRSQRHLLGMINDLLNLARCDSGQVEYAIEHVALAPVLENAVTVLAPFASGAGLTCSVTSPATAHDPILVQADVEKLDQILMNVIGNAIKFSPNGGEITVHASRSTTDASLATISVRDTGVGIAPAKLASIFEPFAPRGAIVTSPDDGVGLGLSISRTLARGMGGDLTATSVLGTGTTLTLTIPLA